MSYELVNQSTEICRTFSKQFWAKALELAGLYGWRPMGTHPPSIHDFYQLGAEWDGRYLTNDGQVVRLKMLTSWQPPWKGRWMIFPMRILT